MKEVINVYIPGVSETLTEQSVENLKDAGLDRVAVYNPYTTKAAKDQCH